MTPVQIGLYVAIGAVVIWIIGPPIASKISEGFAKAKSGDVAGGINKLVEAIKESEIIQKAETIKGTAGNVVAYVEVKSLANHIVDVVSPTDRPAVEQACQTILAAIAAAPVVEAPATKQ